MAIWTWFLAFWQHRTWMPVAIIAIGYVVRLCATDTKFPINIPSRWQPVLVVVLGQVYALLVAVSGGMTWGGAALHGLEVAAWTMGLFDLVIKAVYGNNEPAWLALIVGIVKEEIPKPGDDEMPT